MATIRELITTWGFNIDFNSLEKMDAKVGNLTKDVSRVGENIDRVARSMVGFGTRMTAFVTVPIVGAGFAMANAASDAEETESKFGAVFSGISEESNKVAEDLRNNFGLGRVEAKKLLGDTGDLLTGFGFTQESALDLANQVQELAVDLASFTNIEGGAQRASDALTKALLGERESVKSLGIAILEEDVKSQVAFNTTKGMTFESERQAKAFATLQLAQSQSKNALGDFNRTQLSTANQMKLLTRDMKDEALVVGKILLPALTSIVAKVREVTFWFTQLEEGTKENIVLFLGAIATIGPLILILGLLGVSLISIIRAYGFLKVAIIAARTAMLGLTLASLIVPAILIALGAALVVALNDLWVWARGGESAVGLWLGTWEEALDSFEKFWDNVVLKASESIETIMGLINRPGESLKKLIDDLRFLPGFLGEITGITSLDARSQALLGPTNVGTGGGVNRSSSSNVNATINMSFPEGTPEQQIAQVEEAGKKVVRDEIDILLRRTTNEFPDIE